MVNSRADVTNIAHSTENQNIHNNFDFVGSWKEQTNDNRCGCPTPPADPNKSLQDALAQDIYAQGEITDALKALKPTDGGQVNVAFAAKEIRDAIDGINKGMGHIRDAVGHDEDLSKRDESDPFRRVGSGRQAVKAGRGDLNDALKLLQGDNPDIAGAIRELESGLVHVSGGTGNIAKAADLIERGAKDHRPKHSRDTDATTEHPQPKPVEQPVAERPTLQHDHELHTGQKHLGAELSRLDKAANYIQAGHFNHAYDELKDVLKQHASATKDFTFAFGGELPAAGSFDSARSSIYDAIKNLKDNNFDDALAFINTATDKLTQGSHVIKRDANIT